MPTMPTAPGAPGAPSEISTVTLLCRGIKRSPTANDGLAFYVQQYLTNSPSFTNPAVLGNIKYDNGDTNTFTFQVVVDLRHHFKL